MTKEQIDRKVRDQRRSLVGSLRDAAKAALEQATTLEGNPTARLETGTINAHLHGASMAAAREWALREGVE